MHKAIALTRTFAMPRIYAADALRSAIVSACALALIAAGNVLPF